MEQSRLLIAIALSFLVFFLWSVLFAPEVPETPPDAVPEKAVQTPDDKEQTKAAPETAVQKPAPATTQARPEHRPAREIAIETPLYHLRLSEKGAAVVSMTLKNFRESVAEDSPEKELIPQDMIGGTALLSLTGPGTGGYDDLGELATGLYNLEQSVESLEVSEKPQTVRFTHITQSGLRVEKSYTIQPDSYLIGLEVIIYNSSGSAVQQPLYFVLRDHLNADQRRYGFEGPSGLIDNNLEQIKAGDIEEKNKIEGDIRWIAIETQYFMTSLVPKEAVQGRMMLAHNENIVSSALNFNRDGIGAQGRKSFQLNVFMGPKSVKVLRGLNNELDRAIDFGWFDFIAKPCLWFMNLIYRLIPNYGIAIIILTIVTRLAFWPLATKSYKSMGEMRKLQPLMQEIREKYKNDKQKMNQEMMALYRTYKVNPMSGCLPMLIQLPVFLALYRMLYQAIELRHAPFFGWINDLSAPDRLFNFSFKIPLMEAPYGIPVLTLIMGATMFLQQKMSPAPGDPTQAKMMMLLPLVFTFIFINFSSGLVLYWLVSNILSIAQQYYTNKKSA